MVDKKRQLQLAIKWHKLKKFLQPEANQEGVDNECEVTKEEILENINQKSMNTEIMQFIAKN